MRLFVVTLSFFVSVSGCIRPTSKPLNITHEEHQNVGEPLYLTPLLEKQQISRAQKLSRVQFPNFNGVKSFSGYFTVNKECESNLFFWFFPAQKNWRKAPLVLWLQGGPGVSSLIGLFDGLGPFDSTLKKRTYSWNVRNNLLFIDQPVGSGFSFTRKNCFAKNHTETSDHLYSALTQFYQMFPRLRKNKFYITGQSYAGRFAPSLGYTIHKNNPSAKHKINLSGLMIGNGVMDVMYQSDYSSYLYQLGLVDDLQRDVLRGMEQKLIEHIKKEDWGSGYNSMYDLETGYRKFIGDVSPYNFLESSKKPVFQFIDLITSPRLRKVLHVGNTKFEVSNYHVSLPLKHSTVQSEKSNVEVLLEHYPVIFYQGQLDIICAYPMAVNFFRNLQWSGAKGYLQAERHQWCVKDQLAGFFKSSHNLHEVLVRDAGHMVPKDQPLWAFQLVNSVTSSPAQDPLHQLRTCGKSN